MRPSEKIYNKSLNGNLKQKMVYFFLNKKPSIKHSKFRVIPAPPDTTPWITKN